MPFPLIPFLAGAAAGAAMTYWYQRHENQNEAPATRPKASENSAETDQEEKAAD